MPGSGEVLDPEGGATGAGHPENVREKGGGSLTPDGSEQPPGWLRLPRGRSLAFAVLTLLRGVLAPRSRSSGSDDPAQTVSRSLGFLGF